MYTNIIILLKHNIIQLINMEKQNQTQEPEQPEIEIYEDFDDMNLNDKLLRGIYGHGYEKPSAIQQKAILPFCSGRDIIAQAQSGTGKTATFTIGILSRLDLEVNETQAIILAHTRELANQIHSVVKSIGSYTNVTINLTVGGKSIHENIEELCRRPHIVIGTPGRVLDMINKRHLVVDKLKMLVIDEADELLSNIFINQVYDIFKMLPATMQVGLFSATMNDHFFSITEKFMRDPIKILVKNEQLTLEGIKQYYVNVEKNEFKFDTLCDLYSSFAVSQSIIYCNSKKMVDILANKLQSEQYSVCFIHGDMSQSDRNEIVKDFRAGKTRVLISTDLLSRGIDIQQISIVINYDLPKDLENYIHRIGRSGRFGRKGVAINFITNYDIDKMKRIEEYYNTLIEELPNVDVLNVN